MFYSNGNGDTDGHIASFGAWSPTNDTWPYQTLDDEHAVSPVEQIHHALRKAQIRRSVFVRLLMKGFVSSGHQEVRSLPPAELQAEVETTRLLQASLSLNGSFSPSSELTDFWVRGAMALAQEAKVPSTSTDLAKSEIEIKQEFVKTLNSLLGTIAQQLRYSSSKDTKITQSGKFGLRYQINICDRFFIIPDEAQQFLALLRRELLAAMRSGGKIAGNWGHIELDKINDLYYQLTPPNTKVDPLFISSEEVE